MNEEKDQLLKEIAAEEEIIAKLPLYKETDDRVVWQERAKHQTNLNEKKGQLQLIEEEERIASGRLCVLLPTSRGVCNEWIWFANSANCFTFYCGVYIVCLHNIYYVLTSYYSSI